MSRHKYRCPECGVSMSTDVKPTVQPTHRCARHVNKVRPLETVETAPEPETGA